MIRAFILGCMLVTGFAAQANDTDLSALGKAYFKAWTDTQTPHATEDNLHHYLSFLSDDVGHQHIPYDNDDTRAPDGKASMLQGMMVYLGAHTAYQATLNTVVAGHNVVVITYTTTSSGIHPQTKETIELHYDTMEVLEIEDGKVAVIRKYEE